MRKNEKKTVPKKHTALRKIMTTLLILAVLCVVGFAALIGHVCYKETHVATPDDYDAIIVLGAQVKPTGEPSVQLQWRLDKALEMYTQNPCPIVVCGAKGANEPDTEASVMRAVLLAAGVADEMILPDPISYDTQGNIANALALLKTHDEKIASPLIVTSDYHLPRAISIAKDQGAKAQGVGSPCKPELGFWFKNHAREALAWVKYWGIKYLGLKL